VRAVPGFPAVVTALSLLLAAPPPTPARPIEVVAEVPVLMYHVVGDPPPGAAWPHLFVPARELEDQVAWLEEHGFRAVTLSQVWRNWQGLDALPARPVVLTFDDGDASQAQRALPILARHGWPAVLNLKVGNLGRGGITELQVRKLLDAGWELGAHTITHPDLTTLGADALRREVAGSRAEIARRFGVEPLFFCYPAGRYDARVARAVRAAGFRGATTTDIGLARRSELFTLRRIRVDRGAGARGLSELLARTGAWPGSAPRARGSGTRA